MIYNEYTISIELFSMIYKTGRVHLLSYGGIVPGYLLKWKFTAIIGFLNDMLGFGENDMTKEILKTKMSNLINNILPNLYNGLQLNPIHEMMDYYKSYFGKEFKGVKDLKTILNEQNKQIKMYKALFPPDKIKFDKKFNFDEFINGLEEIRGIQINRNDKLYTVESHYRRAIELNNERQRILKQ